MCCLVLVTMATLRVPDAQKVALICIQSTHKDQVVIQTVQNCVLLLVIVNHLHGVHGGDCHPETCAQ